MDIKKFLEHDRQLGGLERSFLIFVIIMIAAVGLFAFNSGRVKEANIGSYKECIEAGYPIMESYPEQCSANGQTFTNTVTNTN